MARTYMKLDGNLIPILLGSISKEEPKFLFYGGSSTNTVIKADLDDLSTLNTSVRLS